MSNVRSKSSTWASPLSLCHILCLCATWIRYTQAQAASGDYVHTVQGGGDLALIPSAVQGSPSASSVPDQSSSTSVAVISSGPPASFFIPSQAPQPSQSMPNLPIPTVSAIPTAITPSPSGPRPIGSAPYPSNAPTKSLGAPNGTPVMSSTDEGLKPIPPAATQTGDPNGHHEITEPNFSATRPCRGCSPVVEISAPGWLDNTAEEQQGTTTLPIRATISAGPSNVVISQAPSDGGFVVGGSTTIKPGQTITVDNTPIAIQTTAGRVEVIVGTSVMPIVAPNQLQSAQWTHATHVPTQIPPVLTIGSETIAANPQSQYVFSGQTLSPGGPAITVSGTTISLAPAATAVVINGATSTMAPNFGFVFTTAAPALTFKDHVYTVNRAGFITLAPGTVLKPGGAPVTIDGTVLSLDHSGTAVVVQGSTSLMQPVSTVVTLTRSVGGAGNGNGNPGRTSGDWALPTGKAQAPTKPVSGANSVSSDLLKIENWLSGLFILVWWALGYMAVGL